MGDICRRNLKGYTRMLRSIDNFYEALTSFYSSCETYVGEISSVRPWFYNASTIPFGDGDGLDQNRAVREVQTGAFFRSKVTRCQRPYILARIRMVLLAFPLLLGSSFSLISPPFRAWATEPSFFKPSVTGGSFYSAFTFLCTSEASLILEIQPKRSEALGDFPPPLET